MQKTYQKIAAAIDCIRPSFRPRDLIVPIGFDGACVYHLLYTRMQQFYYSPLDHLEHTVQVSSASDNYDRVKFERLCKKVHLDTRFCALDLRTKTGSLGKFMRREFQRYARDFSDHFQYIVLFDPDFHADLRGSADAFTDEERAQVLWVPSRTDVDTYMRPQGPQQEWRYRLFHDELAALPHMASLAAALQDR